MLHNLVQWWLYHNSFFGGTSYEDISRKLISYFKDNNSFLILLFIFHYM